MLNLMVKKVWTLVMNGPHLLTVLLTCVFFNCMLVHSVSPDSMLPVTMVSIPKSNKSLLTCSDNYSANHSAL